MKYCISLYRNHPLQDTVDEMIVKYNAKDKTMFELPEVKKRKKELYNIGSFCYSRFVKNITIPI